MKSVYNAMVMICAAMSLTLGFNILAQAEVLYTEWRGPTNDGLLYAYTGYSATNANTLTNFAPPDGTAPSDPLGYQPQGLAVSPTDGKVYMALYKRTGTSPSFVYDLKIRSYNPTTGAYSSDVFSSANADYVIRGVAFDSSGNLYASLGNKAIAKGTYNSGSGAWDWNYAWGDAYAETGYNNYALDLTAQGGYLYGTVQGVGTGYTDKGRVVKWALDGTDEGNVSRVSNDTTNIRVSGLTFGPDGTLYTSIADTSGANANSIGYWSTTTNPFDTFNVLKTSLDRPFGIDYHNGNLFVSNGKTTNVAAKVGRYNLADGIWTASWSTAPSTTYKDSGYLVIVPEPATLTLLAVGLVGLLAYAWRKRK